MSDRNIPTELESLKARVFDSKGWNKAFVEGALIHDLWAEIERLATEVASWKAVAHDHSGRLAIQEVNLLAFRQIELERDAAIEKLAELRAALERIEAHCGEIRGGAPPHVWIPSLVRKALGPAVDVPDAAPATNLLVKHSADCLWPKGHTECTCGAHTRSAEPT